MAVSLSALHACHTFNPQEDSWYSFLLEAVSTPGAIVRLEGLGKLKKSNALIGNPTRNIPACTIVPQPTTLPHVCERCAENNIWTLTRMILTGRLIKIQNEELPSLYSTPNINTAIKSWIGCSGDVGRRDRT
jgi:hypothetical protein